MIKLIVGNKGSGKTKALINMINEDSKTSKGNIICIEKGTKLAYDIRLKARMIDIDHYAVNGFDMFYGFIAGLLAGNYDITEVFIDGTFKIGGRDFEAFADMIEKLNALVEENNVKMVFTASCDRSELPARLESYIL